jgi:cell division protein FtsI (penicillin-binding protein 3)
MSKSKSDLSWKVDLFYYLMIIAALIYVTNIVYIQLFEREELVEYAEQREDKYFVEKAARGNILSNNGSLLATSVPRYNIIFDPVAVKSEIFDKEVSALADSLNRLFHYKTK